MFLTPTSYQCTPSPPPEQDCICPHTVVTAAVASRYADALKKGLQPALGGKGNMVRMTAHNVDAHCVLKHIQANTTFYMKRLGEFCASILYIYTPASSAHMITHAQTHT
jgi:hypothetical protein